ncbi:MAG: hypothetical protein NZ455_06700 [Bacteroidia bacterium]|nr:hypothetical protein [Bacteroidia bacterium]
MRQHGAKPLAHSFTLAQGVGGWGRSTEAIAQPAARRPERSEGHAQK